MSVLEIRDLHVTVETDAGTTPILNGVTLTIRTGETHAIMGPNGSGKSTLAYTIAGHPKYTVTSGSISLDGEDVLAMTVDERARAVLFLAMQYPVEIPGVRSEEHTSELQSLMRISYAVFCLKKKTNKTYKHISNYHIK